jgi:Flp pilus assembly secretin CpaC
VRIKDGGTVALAGLTENRTQLKYKRVPGISRVPLIGYLFRNNESDESTREIAVFVTAHLVSETGQPVSFGGPPSAGIQVPGSTLPQFGGERSGDQGFKMRLRDSLSRF